MGGRTGGRADKRKRDQQKRDMRKGGQTEESTDGRADKRKRDQQKRDKRKRVQRKERETNEGKTNGRGDKTILHSIEIL